MIKLKNFKKEIVHIKTKHIYFHTFPKNEKNNEFESTM